MYIFSYRQLLGTFEFEFFLKRSPAQLLYYPGVVALIEDLGGKWLMCCTLVFDVFFLRFEGLRWLFIR